MEVAPQAGTRSGFPQVVRVFLADYRAECPVEYFRAAPQVENLAESLGHHLP